MHLRKGVFFCTVALILLFGVKAVSAKGYTCDLGGTKVYKNGNYYKWNQAAGDYTNLVARNGVNYPIEQDVQIISVMASVVHPMEPNLPIAGQEQMEYMIFTPTHVLFATTQREQQIPLEAGFKI